VDSESCEGGKSRRTSLWWWMAVPDASEDIVVVIIQSRTWFLTGLVNRLKSLVLFIEVVLGSHISGDTSQRPPIVIVTNQQTEVVKEYEGTLKRLLVV
jgi:hypothetical protein